MNSGSFSFWFICLRQNQPKVNTHPLLFLNLIFGNMNVVLYIIIIITGWLVYKIISSSRKEEGYKRWKAGMYSEDYSSQKKEEKSTNKWSCKSYLRSLRSGSNRFKQDALIWCVKLLPINENDLREILDYVPGQYNTFTLRKRSGGYRYIHAPSEQLMKVQQAIHHRILTSVAIHPAAMGFRQGVSVSANARAHLGKKHVLKVDLHDFFPSIRSRRVMAAFEEIGYPHPVARVLTELCCLKRKLPQGAPTSPALSNIIALSMDKKMVALANHYGLVYTRYADDLTFSGDCVSKKSLLPMIQQIVEEEGFTLNRKKTRFLSGHKRKIITGISISSGEKLTIPKAKKREIRKNVHFILTKGLKEHQSYIGSTDPVYLKRLLGYLAYWHSVEPDNRYVIDSMTALQRLTQ